MHPTHISKTKVFYTLCLSVFLAGCNLDLGSIGTTQNDQSIETTSVASATPVDSESEQLVKRIHELEDELETVREAQLVERELANLNRELQIQLDALQQDNESLNKQLELATSGNVGNNDTVTEQLGSRNLSLQDEVARISQSMNQMRQQTQSEQLQMTGDRKALQDELEGSRQQLADVTQKLAQAESQIEALMGEIDTIAVAAQDEKALTQSIK
jgi:hypothetical protein